MPTARVVPALDEVEDREAGVRLRGEPLAGEQLAGGGRVGPRRGALGLVGIRSGALDIVGSRRGSLTRVALPLTLGPELVPRPTHAQNTDQTRTKRARG